MPSIRKLVLIAGDYTREFSAVEYNRAKYFVEGNDGIISDVNILGDINGKLRFTAGGKVKVNYYIYFDAKDAEGGDLYAFADGVPGLPKDDRDALKALVGRKDIRVVTAEAYAAELETAEPVSLPEPTEAAFVPAASAAEPEGEPEP